MIEIINNPKKNDWEKIVTRPHIENTKLEESVKEILNSVKTLGDAAVLKYTNMFDNPNQKQILVSGEEINAACDKVDSRLKSAIEQAAHNIEKFHRSQIEEPKIIETQPGVKCWRKSVAIEKVGLYIPGGTAPLFSTVLMLGIPAKIANCKEIVLCTPEGKENSIHPAILYAAKVVGITNIYKIGGAQAIAAMAYGTETVTKVSKIFGPGNQYVTKAKMLVSMSGTAIDMPAGPSEVMIVADETANTSFIASDMLSQCEHGADSQAILVTNSTKVAQQTKTEIEQQVAQLSRQSLTTQSLNNSKIIILNDQKEIIDFMNEYAAEHLILSVSDPSKFSEYVINAGSVFLGNYSPESVGDYASGTNHTLPTNGYAKAYSGVSLDSFIRKITFQELSQQGLKNIGHIVETMAEFENLDAHKNAVTLRLSSIQ